MDNCTSLADCQAALPGLNVACYGANVGCQCSSGFGLDGAQCASASDATPGTRAALYAGLTVVVLTAMRHLPTLYRAFILRRLRFDPAGLTFVLMTLALVALVAQSICFVLLSYMWTPLLSYLADAFGVCAIGFVTGAVAVKSSTFYLLAMSSIKTNRSQLPQAVALASVVGVGAAGALCFSLASVKAWSIFVAAEIGVLMVAAIVGPFTLYVKSARNMAVVAGRSPPGVRTLFLACVSELVRGNRAMRRTLGLYGTVSDDDDAADDDQLTSASKLSKDSREPAEDESGVRVVLNQVASALNASFRVSARRPAMDEDVIVNPQPSAAVALDESSPADDARLSVRVMLAHVASTLGSSFRASSRRLVADEDAPHLKAATMAPTDADAPAKLRKFFLDGSANVSRMAHVRRRETALVRFLGRSIRANTKLSFFLFLYALASVAVVFVADWHDASPSVRALALLCAIQVACLALALYQLFWFFANKFRVSARASMPPTVTPGPSKQASREGSRVASRPGSFVAANDANAPSAAGAAVLGAPDTSGLVASVERAALRHATNGHSRDDDDDSDEATPESGPRDTAVAAYQSASLDDDAV